MTLLKIFENQKVSTGGLQLMSLAGLWNTKLVCKIPVLLETGGENLTTLPFIIASKSTKYLVAWRNVTLSIQRSIK